MQEKNIKDIILTHPSLQEGWRRVKSITRTTNGWRVETQEIGPDQDSRWGRGPTVEVSDLWISQAEVAISAKAVAEGDLAKVQDALADEWQVTAALSKDGVTVKWPCEAHHGKTWTETAIVTPGTVGAILPRIQSDRVRWLSDRVRWGVHSSQAKREEIVREAIAAKLDLAGELVSQRGGPSGGAVLLIGDTVVAKVRYSARTSHDGLDAGERSKADAWGAHSQFAGWNITIHPTLTGAEIDCLLEAARQAEAAALEAEETARAARQAERDAEYAAYMAEVEAERVAREGDTREKHLARVKAEWPKMLQYTQNSGGYKSLHQDAKDLLERIREAQNLAEIRRSARRDARIGTLTQSVATPPAPVAPPQPKGMSSLGDAFGALGL